MTEVKTKTLTFKPNTNYHPVDTEQIVLFGFCSAVILVGVIILTVIFKWGHRKMLEINCEKRIKNQKIHENKQKSENKS